MTNLVYNVATSLAVPVGAAWLAVRARHRPLLGRFAPPVPATGGRPLWVQACSVGEVGTAQPIIAALRRRWPDVAVVLTVSTVSGRSLAASRCPEAAVTWFPFDHLATVRRFIRRLSPRLLVLVETEIWPNVVSEARRQGVPVVVVNGRISDKHYRRYRQFSRFLSPVFAQISAAGVQNGEYAERLIRLGVDRSAVYVTGNTKFDGVATVYDAVSAARLREENGFRTEDPLAVFGSTRPGDEELAAQCWRALRSEFPRLRLIIAPRHLDRLDAVTALFQEPFALRSAVKGGKRPGPERVFVLDTLGELASFYGIASVAIIGGSFFPGVNGHNPLESAALGVPTVFGPFMRNFIDPARVLLDAEGAVQVARPEDLLGVLRLLLRDPNGRARIGARGREAVLAGQGAIGRSVELIARVLDRAAGLPPVHVESDGSTGLSSV